LLILDGLIKRKKHSSEKIKKIKTSKIQKTIDSEIIYLSYPSSLKRLSLRNNKITNVSVNNLIDLLYCSHLLSFFCNSNIYSNFDFSPISDNFPYFLLSSDHLHLSNNSLSSPKLLSNLTSIFFSGKNY
jgi:hypothetical protein